MKKKILFLMVIFYGQTSISQIATITPSSFSIAGASVADKHTWSAFHNPAILGYTEKKELSVRFDRRFFIDKLSTKSIQVAIPFKQMNTGFSFAYFGYSLYHEMTTGITLARNFDKKFSLGMEFNYYSAYFQATNSYRSALITQVGTSVNLSSNWNIGFHAFNPFQSNIKTEFVTKRIPSVFSLGTNYQFNEDINWLTQIDKEISSNYRFATGMEYLMMEKMKIKTGVYHNGYLVPCIGTAFLFGRFYTDFNCELHPLIGLSTLIAVKYIIK